MKASLRNAGEAGLSCCKLPINLSSAFWWALGRPGTRRRAPQWVNRNIIIGYDTRRWSTNRATLLLFGTLRDMYYIHIYMCIYVYMYVCMYCQSSIHMFIPFAPDCLVNLLSSVCAHAMRPKAGGTWRDRFEPWKQAWPLEDCLAWQPFGIFIEGGEVTKVI